MVTKISGEDFFRLLDRVVTHEMIDVMLFPNFLTRP